MTHGGWKAPSTIPREAISAVAFFSAKALGVIDVSLGISAWVVSGSEACDLISVLSPADSASAVAAALEA